VKTLVLGLGNPILGDDGVGWQIASALQNFNNIPPDVTIDCLAVGGFSLMEAMIGYDRTILIDAIVTHEKPIGSVASLRLEDLPNPAGGHTGSAHDTSLQNALEIGRSLGAHLPKDIWVVTVESQKVYEFSDDLTPPVAAAIPEAVGLIQKLLIEYISGQAPTEKYQNNEEELP
jgi:hydrogenase maturation protease